MKSTGIMRNIDSLGRVVLPARMRKHLEWDVGTPLEVYADGRGIFLQKYTNSCIFCGAEKDIKIFENKPVCCDCIARLQK